VMLLCSILLALEVLLSFAVAISPIHITGTKFFDSNGNQIFFKGILRLKKGVEVNLGMAYQRAPFDPFLNGTQCLLDANLMKTLGVNVIRSAPTQTGDAC
jgi:1,3-beta-glucanosyltransferase GAS1